MRFTLTTSKGDTHGLVCSAEVRENPLPFAGAVSSGQGHGNKGVEGVGCEPRIQGAV